eukprot:12209883-Heterocapsa_arctica.AAC.1
MSQVTLLMKSKLKLAEDRLLEHIMLLSARTSLMEASRTLPDMHESTHLSDDSLAAHHPRKNPDTSRK